MKNISGQKKITAITKQIVKKFQPKKIILFGSWAWGKPKADSDIDLFIVKETNNTRILARKIDAYLFPRQFPIDIIVYKPEQVASRLQAGDFFLKDIINRGKVLYEQS